MGIDSDFSSGPTVPKERSNTTEDSTPKAHIAGSRRSSADSAPPVSSPLLMKVACIVLVAGSEPKDPLCQRPAGLIALAFSLCGRSADSRRNLDVLAVAPCAIRQEVDQSKHLPMGRS